MLCNKFLREKYGNASVSLRELGKFKILFDYYIKLFKSNEIMKTLNMTFYLIYYIRLHKNEYRKEFIEIMNTQFKDFIAFPQEEIKRVTETSFSLAKEEFKYFNWTFQESLYINFICIINSLPLITFGKPSTCKSLINKILYDNLKGIYSESDQLKEFGKLFFFKYFGGKNNESSEFENILRKVYFENKTSKKTICCLLYENMEFDIKSELFKDKINFLR